MKLKYKHTNLIAHDWKKLVKFYQDVFGCIPIPPERNLSGMWLEKGTGIKGASFSGVHLRLPGYGEDGPTLEIYQYQRNEAKLSPAANREGFGHIAFEVEDVTEMMDKVLKNGGSKIGDIVTSPIAGAGTIIFVYLADPEENIIELQCWI